jgi:hypothetical protein
MLRRRLFASFAGAAAFAVLPAVVRADSISIESTGISTEDLGAFTGTIDFSANAFGGAAHADLAVTLTNTSPISKGGYITGFVFNIADVPDNSIAATYVASTGDKFKTLTNESASPFGTFEYGTAIGGAWLGGGSPTSGIAVGQSRTFLFELSGNSETTAGLTAASFLTNNLPGGTVYPLAVRFRGFANGGSDKVIGGEPTPPPPPPPPPSQAVPVPAAVWGGMVLLGFLGVGKRIRSRKGEADIG